jgi:hypothetical protein
MSWLVFALLLPVLAAGAAAVWRRPLAAVLAFVVGLAFHNAVFMALWLAGAHGWQLKVLQGWKEILLATALLSVARRAWVARGLPFRPVALDAAAAALALVAVAYAFYPAAATVEARFYGLRSMALPVAAYALGRALAVGPRTWGRLALLALATSFAVAAAGIVENYALSLDRWRAWKASGYFSEQLGFPVLHGPAGLPDNWARNLSSGVFRRLISTYLSPLGTSYMLGLALLLALALWCRARGRARVALALASGVVLVAFLLTFSRAAAIAVVGGLLVLAFVTRSRTAVAAAAVVLVASVAVAAAFASVAPRTHVFPEDQPWLDEQAQLHGDVPKGNPLHTTSTLSDSSSREHLRELRRSFENVVHRPFGHGLGESGQIAERFGDEPAAGESLYLTVGAETGVFGLAALLALVALTLSTLFSAARRFAGSTLGLAAAVLLSAQATVFAIGVQTEVWGVPWLVYVLWPLTGAVVTAAQLPGAAAAPTAAAPTAAGEAAA